MRVICLSRGLFSCKSPLFFNPNFGLKNSPTNALSRIRSFARCNERPEALPLDTATFCKRWTKTSVSLRFSLLISIFFDHVCFEDVANLQVAELLDTHTTLVTSCNLFDVVFETFERGQVLVSDNNTVTNNTNLCISGDLTFQNIASCNGADTSDLDILHEPLHGPAQPHGS